MTCRRSETKKKTESNAHVKRAANEEAPIDRCLFMYSEKRSHTIDNNNKRTAATATPESVMNRPKPVHMCRNVLYFDQFGCEGTVARRCAAERVCVRFVFY